MPRAPCVYIIANDRNGTLYTGVTSNLAQRIHQHREGFGEGFTRRYRCKLLVFYETYERMDEAIAREKQIKGGSRARKPALIEAMNPQLARPLCGLCVSDRSPVIARSEATKQSRGHSTAVYGPLAPHAPPPLDCFVARTPSQ